MCLEKNIALSSFLDFSGSHGSDAGQSRAEERDVARTESGNEGRLPAFVRRAASLAILPAQ